MPEPNYGDQLNGHAVHDVPPEGRVVVTYEEIPGAFEDGEPYSLRNPTYTFTRSQLRADAPGDPEVAAGGARHGWPGAARSRARADVDGRGRPRRRQWRRHLRAG